MECVIYEVWCNCWITLVAKIRYRRSTPWIGAGLNPYKPSSREIMPDCLAVCNVTLGWIFLSLIVLLAYGWQVHFFVVRCELYGGPQVTTFIPPKRQYNDMTTTSQQHDNDITTTQRHHNDNTTTTQQHYNNTTTTWQHHNTTTPQQQHNSFKTSGRSSTCDAV